MTVGGRGAMDTPPESFHRRFMLSKERRREISAKWYANNKGLHLHRTWLCRLKRNFNLTLEGYNALLVSQGGLCSICKQPPEDNEHLCVDHDHTCCPGDKSCGQCIRGLICQHCNKGLGN